MTPAEQHAVRAIATMLRSMLDAGAWEDIALAQIAGDMPAKYRIFSRLVRRGAFDGLTLHDVAKVYGGVQRQAAA
jgi:hypothetical protein